MVYTKLSTAVIVAVIAAAMAAKAAAQPQIPACAEQLISCVAYLNSTKPPASCCNPVKQALTKDFNCICNLLKNSELLKNFNINVTQAENLPKACGINKDINSCSASALSISPSPSSMPPPATPGSGNGDKNSAEKIVGSAISNLLFISAFLMF